MLSALELAMALAPIGLVDLIQVIDLIDLIHLIHLTPSVDRWASWRWLATPDERVLWATLAAAALLAVWGGFVGARRGR